MKWTSVSVIGAAGKMGKGISLILLQEMAKREAKEYGEVGTGNYSLYLIDANEQPLYALRKYLRPHLIIYAERNINALRTYFEHNAQLVSNEEMIQAFAQGALDLIRPTTDINKAANSLLIFESIEESSSKKIALYQQLNKICQREALFLSNTSSIPIAYLNEQAGVNQRIIGVHFYNPPEVQKVVEIVYPSGCEKKVKEEIQALATDLKKKTVISEDVAGFIGNGHFLREIDFSCRQVGELTKNYPEDQAIAMIDRITKELLLRPMGIFQLIDFVGIDVCSNISKIMTKFLGQDFTSNLLEQMLQKKKIGGQNLDGSQKEGFFQYAKGQPVAIFSLEKESYQPFPERLEKLLVVTPSMSWKTLHKDPQAKEKIAAHFQTLQSTSSLGSELALAFLHHSSEAAKELVDRGIAQAAQDIDTILKLGFNHLYGLEELMNASFG